MTGVIEKEMQVLRLHNAQKQDNNQSHEEEEEETQNNPNYEHLLNVVSDGFNQLIATFYA